MAAAVDITLLGQKQLERKLELLAAKTQKTIVRRAVRASAKRTLAEIVHNIQSAQLVDSGRLLAAFQKAKVLQAANKRDLIRIGPAWPTRAELGIDPKDKGYYPFSLEFGHPNAAAVPFIRPAVDENRQREIRQIGTEIGAAIEREARKGVQQS